MLVDYHTHHARCGHASGGMAAYIEAAIARGLGEIGLSDHSPIYDRGDEPHPLPRPRCPGSSCRPTLPRWRRCATATPG